MSDWRVVLLLGVLLLTVISLTKSIPLELSDEQNADEPSESTNRSTEEEKDEETPDDDDDYKPGLDTPQLIQGDIVKDAPTGDDGIRHQGVDADLTWPNGVVPYSIHKSISSFASRKMIIRAMKTIESVSCIKFKERKNSDRHFIRISNANRLCYSVLGRSTDDEYFNVGQPLLLDNNCFSKGTVLHILMHALGFHHEQARTDRDEFIEIDYDNVKSEKQEYFEKTSDPVTHLGTPYDYSSIMHYKWNEYAVDSNKSTIKIKNKKAINSKILGIGESSRLSPTDIIEINALYNCSTDGPLLAPDDIQYREGDSWVSVSWKPPRVAKNRKINGYKIHYNIDSAIPIADWQTVFISNATARNWKVEGLLRSTTYVFRMSAIDENVSGSLSNPIVCKTTVTVHRTSPDRPSPPTKIRFRSGKSFTMVYWRPPPETNGIIVGYEIYYTDDALTPLDQWTEVYISDPYQKKFKIEGLREGTTYGIRMRASNKNGSGMLSKTVTVTTTTSTA